MPSDKWRHAIYSMWPFVGLAVIVLVLIPETPRFHAQRGNHNKAKEIMKKIYSTVPNYDVEHEYSIIMKEIEDGRILADNQKGVSVWDCFRGTNLVSLYNNCSKFKSKALSLASNNSLSRAIQQPALGWGASVVFLYFILFSTGRTKGSLRCHTHIKFCPCWLCCHQFLHHRPYRSSSITRLFGCIHGSAIVHHRWYPNHTSDERNWFCYDCGVVRCHLLRVFCYNSHFLGASGSLPTLPQLVRSDFLFLQTVPPLCYVPKQPIWVPSLSLSCH